MKIVVLGAGQVGSTVAEILAGEENDITVVDIDAEAVTGLQERLDIRTVVGHGAHPEVLLGAGVREADILLAVTSNDEINMVACQVACSLFNVPTKIARIRDPAYLKYPQMFAQDALPVDVLISPEQLVTLYIEKLIQYPGALQVLDFANGRVQLVAVRAHRGGPLVGHELRALREHMPSIDARVAAIYRRGDAVMPNGDTVLEADDEVFFIAASKDIRAVMSELMKLERPVQRVIIAGGGNIGRRLALALEDRYNVKIIEKMTIPAQQLSEQLSNTLVLKGDVADEELLLSENIGHTDVFVAVTNDEEANILSSLLAKRLGARRVMALINRAAYVDLLQSGEIDVAISPKQATISSLLAHVRHGDVVEVHSLRRGAAEAIEAVAHGDPTTSRVVGRTLEQIRLPSGATIGAVVRNDEVLMGHHDLLIVADDHVIIFLTDKRQIPEIERLFEVRAP
ncbi:MAG: Trk system potassium transporter TrkA [Gammaproteobacteria bacterium]|nr:Trk system potassium transporter TrkA [Gammaproteobacteria bacterium]